VPAAPVAGPIARATAELAADRARGEVLRRRATELGLVNGVNEAVAALQRLARPASSTRLSLQEA
jgi:hypothetical protein